MLFAYDDPKQGCLPETVHPTDKTGGIFAYKIILSFFSENFRHDVYIKMVHHEDSTEKMALWLGTALKDVHCYSLLS